MPTDHRAELKRIRDFRSLIRYLRDEMDWPIDADRLEEVTFEYTPEELGIDLRTAAKIRKDGIRRLRPLSANQPWGIFFVEFEPKRLPVVALRRILSQVVLKKRASAQSSERVSWAPDDLLFISNYGDGEARQISFAHFSQDEAAQKLPTLNVLGWDNLDTLLHLDAVADALTKSLVWPKDTSDLGAWRRQWRGAFTLRHRQVITTSRGLSVRLAELARRIRDRITTALAIETDKGPLTKLLKAFQESLVHDLDARGFADMYAQTIAYGLLSARIAEPENKAPDDFASHMRTSPFLREMMETFLKVGGRYGRAGGAGIDFDELGVSEVAELLEDPNTHMAAVIRDFGDRNPQEDPVIHFYEHFLEEYDAEQKAKRGVFYTPRPVVSYIVRSVDELLRSEFGLVNGLADTTTWGELAIRHQDLRIPDGISPEQQFVQILDPATGTGTFLVEVIDVIYKTLIGNWKAQGHSEAELGALWNEYVPKHLLPRLHGYELLMAPYAIAHLKLGLKLYETGYRFDSEQRARIYLTNSLEPAHDFSTTFDFAIPALAHEVQAVNEIKANQRFTVVVGNPPYSSSSQNREPWAMQLIEDYKTTVREAETQIQALSDDYVKFTRLAQLCTEKAGHGIVGFITNNNFQSATTFRDMRGSLLHAFNLIHLVDLHGNGRLREIAMDGTTDENVFDILAGVCVSVLGSCPRIGEVRTRTDLLGSRQAKYDWLVKGDDHAVVRSSFAAAPPQHSFLHVRAELSAEYEAGTYLPEVFGTGKYDVDKTTWYGSGFKSQQDEFAISFTEAEVREKVRFLLRQSTTEQNLRDRYAMCATEQWSFDLARRELRSIDWEDLLCPCLYRPFDVRFTIIHRAVVSNPRTQVMSQFLKPNVGICVGRQGQAIPGGWDIVFVTRHPEDQNLFYRGGNTNFPVFWYDEATGLGLESGRRHNLSPRFLSELADAVATSRTQSTGLPEGITAEDVIHYVYSVLHSLAYRHRYAEFLKVDFPRIPLPCGRELFRSLARHGGELISLHLLESPKLNAFMTTYNGPNNPEVGRVGWSDDTVWLDVAATRRGQPPTRGTIGFRGVPEAVWNFRIGGYQVCEKWLKDRKGRTLSKDDIAHYQRTIAALSDTIRLVAEIDDVIEQHGGWPGAFAKREEAVILANADSQPRSRPDAPRYEDQADSQPLRKVAEPETVPYAREVEHEGGGVHSRRDELHREDLICRIRQFFSVGGERERESAIDELARELGYQRTATRVHEELDNALRTAVRRGILSNRDGALCLFARTIEQYDREFLKEQFLASLPGRHWAEREDAIRGFARWLGFKRTGAAINEMARSLVNGLLREERLERYESRIRRIG